MTDAAMEAAARALAKTNVFTACPGYDETRFNEDREAYDRMAQAAITAWLAAEDEERVERVARALFECEKEERGDTREFEQVRSNTRKMYRRHVRAAIKVLSE